MRPTMTTLVRTCLTFVVFSATMFAVAITTTAAIDEEMVYRAMQDEMQRNMRELQLGDLPRAYHMTYSLSIRKSISVHSTLGDVQDVDTGTVAILSVAVRVGGPKFDNTNYFDVSLGFFGSSDDEEAFRTRRIPFEYTYNSLRRELWLATDACYKQAVELYAKKEGSLKNRTRTDTTWDFGYLLPETLINVTGVDRKWDVTTLQNLCSDVSAVFRSAPGVQSVRVGTEYVPEETLLLTSEGRRMHKFESFAGFEIVASGQAPDGMPVGNTYAAYGITPDDFPSRDSLIRAGVIVGDLLTKAMQASTIDAYSGPILFEGQAAGEIIAQVFAPNLVAQRQPLSDGGFSANDRYLAFQNKIGARVLPEWLSVRAVPLRVKDSGRPVAGHYDIDDDGIQAQDVRLVDNGYLKTLLSSRVPTKRISASNGHQRGGAAMLSVIEFEARDNKRQLSAAALRARMMKMVKDRDLPYGIIIRKALNQNLLFTGLYAVAGPDFPLPQGEGKLGLLEVWRVYPDGREEIVRGVESAGLAPVLFKDIIAVGKSTTVHNYLAPSVSPSFITGGAQYLVSTIITPDLLFEDLELRPIEGDMPTTPHLSSPLN